MATARKMTVLAWHLVTKDQDYIFARPALVTHKRRKLELAAGAPSRRGNHRQPGAAYHSKQRRNEKNRRPAYRDRRRLTRHVERDLQTPIIQATGRSNPM